jgi:hypothetical protein
VKKKILVQIREITSLLPLFVKLLKVSKRVVGDIDELHNLRLSDDERWGQSHGLVVGGLCQDSVLKEHLCEMVSIDFDIVRLFDLNA